MPLLIALLVSVVVAMAAFALVSLFDDRSSRARIIKDRLAAVQRTPDQPAVEEVALLRDEQLSQIPALDGILRRSERISAIQIMLAQGDTNMRAGNFLALCAIISLVAGLAAFIWSGKGPVAWVAMLIGFLLPYSYASYRRNKRFEKFEELFPEAIDTLARAVRAGHAFTTAIEMIASEVAEPVCGEFRKLYEEQKFGMPVRDALINLTERVPLVDVKFFVTAVMLQRETGGNLAETLNNLADLLRRRRSLRQKARAMASEARASTMILGSLPIVVALLLLVLSPHYIMTLFTDVRGLILCAIATGMLVIGIGIMVRMAKFEI
jgi:tight adherence protein B